MLNHHKNEWMDQLGVVFVLVILGVLFVGCKDGDTFVVDKDSLSTSEQSSDPRAPQSQADPRLRPDFNDVSEVINFEGNILSSFKTEFYELNVINHKHISEFNFRSFPEGAQEIILTGKDIVLKKGTKLYRALGGEEGLMSAIKVVIHADNLVIENPLWFKSADLEIKARLLKIVGEGRFSTAGISYPAPVEQFKSGVDGTKGGDISLSVKEFINESKLQTPFSLNGGDGVMGGAGRDGAAGGDVPVLSWSGDRAIVYKETETCQQIIRPVMGGGFMKSIAKRMDGNSRCSFTKKEGLRVHSGHGQDAIAGGVPGLGGKAGTLSLNEDVLYETFLKSNIVELEGGKSAASRPMYRGGAAGTPLTTCFLQDYQGGHPDSWHCQTAKKGLDAHSPQAKANFAEDGEILLDKSQHWLSEKVLTHILGSARESFLAQDFKKAKAEYERVLDLVNEAPQKSLALLRTESSALKELEKLYRHQNYFGNQSHWVPHLSLEASLISFEKTLNDSFKGLWLTYWLGNRSNTLEEKQLKIDDELARLRATESTLRTELSALNRRLTNSRDFLSEIRVKEQHFQKSLFELQKLLEEQARNNIKIPHAKKAVALLGALSRSIPVGQPAFGLVGNSLDLLVGAFESEDRLDYAFDNFPDLYEAIGSADFEEAAVEWNEAWQSLSFDDFSGMDREERLNLLKRTGKFYGPIVKEVSSTLKELKEREISKGRFDLELARLKNADPLYQEISGELELLVQKKKRYQDEVLELLSQYNQNSLELIEVFDRAHLLSQEKTSTSLALSPTLKSYLKDSQQKIEERLLKSFYQLVRAYEYRSLKAYQGSLNLRPLREQAIKLAEESHHRELSFYEFESLKSFYLEITAGVRELIESADSSSLVLDYFWVHLDKAHLKELSRGNAVYLSLDQFIIDHHLEDYRLSKIVFENAPIVDIPEDDRFWGTLSLHIVPVSGFHMNRGEDQFFFRFSEDYQKSRGFWGVAMDLWGEGFESLAPDTTALRRGLQSYSGIDLGEANMLAHDGVRTTLKISPSKKFSIDRPIDIKEVRFKVHYTAKRPN